MKLEKNNTGNFYSKIHKELIDNLDHNPPQGLKELFHFLKKQKIKSKALDAGCGFGQSIYLLNKAKFKKIFSIDINPDAKKFITKKYGNITKHKTASVTLMPFKKNNFNFVVCYGVLHHTNDLEKGISEIHRVLKKNGKAIIGLYTFKNSFFHIIVSTLRLISKIIPYGLSSFILKLFCGVHLKNFILDHMYVPILNTYYDKDIIKKLSNKFKVIKSKPCDYDFFQKTFLKKIITGDGLFRMYFIKKIS